MIIRGVIKHYRKRIGRIHHDLKPKDKEEEDILMELFTKKNYVPNNDKMLFTKVDGSNIPFILEDNKKYI